MPTVTISLPKELKERLDKHPDINWSEIFRRSFKNKVKELATKSEFLDESELIKELNTKVDLKIKELISDAKS